MQREVLVIANWKMHGQTEHSRTLLTALKDSVAGVSSTVVICPPALYVPLAQECLQGSNIQVGAQNVYIHEGGAFTGEISALMLRDFDCRYVIVGHSERRELFGDTNELVSEKFKAIQAQAMTPVLCVGETYEQRKQGITDKVVLRQLSAVIETRGIETLANAVIAYEPVWAIGTGLTAGPEQAQEVHETIRVFLSKHDEDVAARTPILYGGSVKGENAAGLFAMPDIDGALVGGASLSAEEFTTICKAAG